METVQADDGPFEDCRVFASKTAEHAARLADVQTLVADPEAMSVTAETLADAVRLAGYRADDAAKLHGAAAVAPHA